VGTQRSEFRSPQSAQAFDFHDKVRHGSLDLAARDPAHHVVIDASKTPEAVWAEVVAKLRTWMTVKG
jgi:thymidylate kinase